MAAVDVAIAAVISRNIEASTITIGLWWYVIIWGVL